jgi:hypothetical protein
MLVITSCTGKKCKNTPRRLVLNDFLDHARLLRRKKDLASFACKATDLYTGDQHVYVTSAIQSLREKYGQKVVTLNIISAGYGLLSENDKVVPYESTFSGMSPNEIDKLSSHLNLPNMVRSAVMNHSLVIFLLGDRYLRGIKIPLEPASHQRFIFLAASSNEEVLRRSGSTVVRAGLQETRVYGSGLVGLKGKIFELLAKGLVIKGAKAFTLLQRDASPKAFLDLVRIGKEIQ